ncbi:MAG: VanW family protein [Polyangiaceae bacterium]
MTKIAPRISSAFLADLDIHQVISQYDTYFSRHGDQSRRGKNIDVAASKVDGLVISPGEVMSFNELVGERSEENGFQKSWEIFKGEMKEGVGGGTCQVASTLHAVSFFGGLDVLERLPHSRPSAYIPMGLDSTVVFPAVDLKLKNPFPFPVVVHARVDGNRLHMELLGREKPATVSFEREVIDTIPFGRKVKEEAGLRGAKVLVKQHGIRGFKIKRTRTYVFKDGSRKKESTTDTYPPTTEIYEVPVGFDQSQLPEPPDATDDDAAPAAKPPTPDATSDGGPKLVASLVPDPNAVQFVDAPGAHAPTDAQRKPPKTMTMRR